MNFGFIAAILTTSAFLPQAIKTIRTRDTKSLSLMTFGLMFCGTICWFIHGLTIQDLAVIYANAITAIPLLIILVMKVIHMTKKST
ncbi:MAG: SemiSWEET transporter [Flavobacteriaceae bacterium]